MAGTSGSDVDPTIDGAQPFNGADIGAGGNLDGIANGGTGPEYNEHGAIKPESVVKRGRGRPRKDGGNSGSGNADETGTKSRQGGSETRKASGLDVDVFATQLVGIHAIIAKVTKNAIWIITPDEAKKLAKSLKEIAAFHKIEIPAKYMVYGNLFAVCASIYGPRLALMALAQKAAENQRKAAEANATIFTADGQPIQ